MLQCGAIGVAAPVTRCNVYTCACRQCSPSKPSALKSVLQHVDIQTH